MLRSSLLCIETAVLLSVLLVLFAFPGVVRALDSINGSFRAVARRRALAVAFVFAFTLVLRIAVLPILQIRPPGVHDEFSYLLLGDTFASGRLVNPTHPMWLHFETFHVLQHPSYASMYPVAQGLFLAAGQAIAHAPWTGVWMSTALMCAAICWMLQGWLPPEWALAGGLLATLRLAVFSYWMNSYWGGAVAALGGALVLGAVPRLLRSIRISNALVLALGIAILANSRPYEGLLLCIAAMGILLIWLLGARGAGRWLGLSWTQPDWKRVTLGVLAPITVVLGLTFAAMGHYFLRVTGSPWTLPHTVEREQYAVVPFFVWQSERPAPTYHNDQIKSFYTQWEADRNSGLERFGVFWAFYFGPALTIPFLLVPWVLRDCRTRALAVVCVVGAFGLMLERWSMAHYAAPFVSAAYGLVLQAMRHLSVWARCGRARLAPLRWAIPTVVVLAFGVRAAAVPLHISTEGWPTSWGDETKALWGRQAVVDRLRAQGGRHLVLVRYGTHHPVSDEWVYNDANIDSSPIVWARELDAEQNRKLVQYFAGRQIWLVLPDEDLLTAYVPIEQTFASNDPHHGLAKKDASGPIDVSVDSQIVPKNKPD